MTTSYGNITLVALSCRVVGCSVQAERFFLERAAVHKGDWTVDAVFLISELQISISVESNQKRGEKMNVKKIGGLVLVLFLCLTFTVYAGEIATVDYSVPEHWLAVPASTDKAVDVFYLYPTVFQKVDKDEPNICNIDNPIMLKNSKLALAFQASAFETTGNVYAPYYRQADAGYTLNLPSAEQDRVIGGVPSADATAAFDYYIRNYNQGRPFILAGHSQGSNVLLYLLSDYMKDHPEVYKRMIAAYVIGYSVTPDYLKKNPHLKFAQGPADTGVIISYNTEAPGVTGRNPVLLPGAQVINPINWTRTEKPASAAENLGSVEAGKDGQMLILKNLADARMDKVRGVVICSTVDIKKYSSANSLFPPGVYHSHDYPFYYYNLRENAAVRTASFLDRL